MKIIDKIGDIDDRHIEKALKIDNKKKLMEEKMRENKKVGIWKYVFVPVTCICLVIIGMVYMQDNNKIARSNNRYLTANYSMLLYKESNDYVKENINLDKLNENDKVTITSDKLIEEVPEEYKYCSGEVIITKNKFGMYEHTVKSSCDNEASDNINLTMRVYTNTNQNNLYKKQIISDINEINGNYKGALANYIVSENGNITSEQYDGISGMITIDKELKVTDINVFDKPKTSMGTKLYTLNKDYIIIEHVNGNTGNQKISYYNSNYKLLWEKELKDYTITDYLYETKNTVVFGEFNKVITINKDNGKIDKVVTVSDLGNISLKYDNGYLFGFDYINTYKIYKISLDGKIISTIDLLKIDGIEKTAEFINSALGNNVSLYSNKNYIYVFNKNGKLINKIDTVITENNTEYKFESFNVSKNSYEIVYNTNTEVYNVAEDGKQELVNANQKKYIKFDLNNNVIVSANIDETYGYNTLSDMGLALNNVFNYSKIINNKLFEYEYSPDNNGTLMLMLYDYVNVNDTNDDGIVNEEEVNVNLSDYKGYWYLNQDEYNGSVNANCLNVKAINNNKLSINLYVTRVADFDFNVTINNNTGTFNANSEFGRIKGNIVLMDNKIKLTITSSTVNGINSGKEYIFNYHNNVSLSEYKGYWYINQDEYNGSDVNYLNIKFITDNRISANLHVAGISSFDFVVSMNNGFGEFYINSGLGHISGNIILMDNKIKLTKVYSSISGMASTSEYVFSYHKNDIAPSSDTLKNMEHMIINPKKTGYSDDNSWILIKYDYAVSNETGRIPLDNRLGTISDSLASEIDGYQYGFITGYYRNSTFYTSIIANKKLIIKKIDFQSDNKSYDNYISVNMPDGYELCGLWEGTRQNNNCSATILYMNDSNIYINTIGENFTNDIYMLNINNKSMTKIKSSYRNGPHSKVVIYKYNNNLILCEDDGYFVIDEVSGKNIELIYSKGQYSSEQLQLVDIKNNELYFSVDTIEYDNEDPPKGRTETHIDYKYNFETTNVTKIKTTSNYISY